MDLNDYRNAYANLGEERVQIVEDNEEIQSLPAEGELTSVEDRFFDSRLDTNWVKIPGILKYHRRLKKRIFYEGVSQILNQLEPAVTFNAAEVWKHEINQNNKKEIAHSTARIDIMREKNFQEQQQRRFVAEVTRIRNSKSNLLAILRDIKIPDARAILFTQILKKTFDGFRATDLKQKKLLYEVLWALNEMELPTINAPQPENNTIVIPNSDVSLVYDDYKEAKSLLKKANKLMAAEEDLIKLQLVDMSDSLPPLSKFSSGFKLDPWQKRVLTWIDAGKSVVICAPTSSGKTVLSSYVAIIFKSHIFKKDGKEENAKPSTKKQLSDKAADSDDDEDDGFEEEEGIAKISSAHTATSEPDELQEFEDEDFSLNLVAEDAKKRSEFLRLKRELQFAERSTVHGSNQRVLFVVPTEPLVWQVAAYFTKLMKEEGDRATRVALVTDQFIFRPKQKIDVVPQIVVGTPFALESALTKPFGLTGREETKGIPAGNILPGGFDHFDWVIYDEVHALDGPEGAALQRLIRAMNCPFLALSATIGNAHQLRSWMESVKGEQMQHVEAITVAPKPDILSSSSVNSASRLNIVGRSEASSTRIGVLKTLVSEVMIFHDSKKSDLLQHLASIWNQLQSDPNVIGLPRSFQLEKTIASQDQYTLAQAGLIPDGITSDVVLEAISDIGEESLTVIGYGKSRQSKLVVQSKFSFVLPTINVLDNHKVQEIQKLLNAVFPILFKEAIERKTQCTLHVKNTQLKENEQKVFELFSSSKSNEKTLDTLLTIASFDASNEIHRVISDFNYTNGIEWSSAKSFPLKLLVQLVLDPFEVHLLESTTVQDLKAHILDLLDRRFPVSSAFEEHIASVSPSVQVHSGKTKMTDNFTLAKYGLFHPSVSNDQRILSGTIQLTSIQQIPSTVVGKPVHSIQVVTIKKYLSFVPLEVLVTKDVTLQELKKHLQSIWQNNLSLVNCDDSLALNLVGFEEHDASIGGSLVSPIEVKHSSDQTVVHEIASEINLTHVTVIGKGNQRPFKLTLVRTVGTEDDESGSSIRCDIIVFEDTTVLEIKKQICVIWKDLNADPSIQAAHVQYPVQVLFKSKDLQIDDSTLHSHGVFDADVNDQDRVLVVRSLVHLLVHQGRFINLQRYIWLQGRKDLNPISPLAAISSMNELQAGILLKSSLSFTSKDCYRTYEEMKKIFPKEVVEEISPYNFFEKRERITLERSKQYEDLLKVKITNLSRTHQKEVETLLNRFQVSETSSEVNLCDLVLRLKELDMLPCLPFHLNTFEAIKLFQQLLADFEYRQKVAYPTYYTDLQAEVNRRKSENQKQLDSTGRNEKDKVEMEKSLEVVGDVDLDAPHLSFTASKGIPQQELDQLMADMERYDGFEKRDASAMKEGPNLAILKHALIRGLRRGIGIFLDEVSFPAYRRAVQKLASNGKLGVVISDTSLAFGVNMPFRTCIFCGEMTGKLDELMAQQMSGRAGRRGLDQQGNVIYAAIRVPMLRRIMIGKISNITGKNNHPRYETLFLQAILSPRHTGYYRTEVLGGRTLSEFIENADYDRRFAMNTSKRTMIDLKFVAATKRKDYQPNYRQQSTFGLLTAIWEMRNCVYESITIGMLFNDIVEDFTPIVSTLSLSDKKRNKEIMEPHIHSFFSILTQLVGRTPASHNRAKAKDLRYFNHQEHLDFYNRWAEKFALQQEELEVKGYSHLKNPVGPEIELDGTFLQCALDRSYVHTLDENAKQEMKGMIWHVGKLLVVLNKASHIEPAYHRLGHFLFRVAFEKLRYLNAQLIATLINFDNVAAAEAERRTDTGGSTAKPIHANSWTDLSRNSWSAAILEVLELNQNKIKPSLGQSSAATATAVVLSNEGESRLNQFIDGYLALSENDLPFIQQCLTTTNILTKSHIETIVKTLLYQSSFALQFPSDQPKYRVKVGLLIWYCLIVNGQAARSFHLYLQSLYEKVTEDEVKEFEQAIFDWESFSLEDFKRYLPNYYKTNAIVKNAPVNSELGITEEQWIELKTRSKSFIEFLRQEDEDDDEEEGEEEEEDL